MAEKVTKHFLQSVPPAPQWGPVLHPSYPKPQDSVVQTPPHWLHGEGEGGGGEPCPPQQLRDSLAQPGCREPEAVWACNSHSPSPSCSRLRRTLPGPAIRLTRGWDWDGCRDRALLAAAQAGAAEAVILSWVGLTCSPSGGEAGGWLGWAGLVCVVGSGPFLADCELG